jgi:AraC family transcriptional regulator
LTLAAAAAAPMRIRSSLSTLYRREAGGLVLASLVPRVPEEEVTRHTHEDAHFVFVTAGRYLSTAAAAPEVGGPPTLIYNPSGTTHRDRFRGGVGRFFTVSLPRTWSDALADDTRMPARPIWLGRPDAIATASRLFRECEAWDDASPLAVHGLVWALAGVTGRAASLRVEHARWLLRLRDRLHDESATPPGLAALAAEAGVHPGHLTRSFRRAFGCTPGEYLRACRAERAARLVRETRAPLAEIAARCGFSDQSHMTRALRRHAGVTPGRARRSRLPARRFVSF